MIAALSAGCAGISLVHMAVASWSPATGRVRQTTRFPVTASIPREDVAAFMLGELERAAFSLRTPMITAT